jgi:hypothetical protein
MGLLAGRAYPAGSRIIQVCLPDQTFPLALDRDGYVIATPWVAQWAMDRHETQIACYARLHNGETRTVDRMPPIPG